MPPPPPPPPPRPPPPSPPSTEIKLFTSDLNVDRSSIVEGVGSVHVDGDATLDGQVTNQGALSVVVNGSLRIGTIGELQAETLIVDVDELELRGRPRRARDGRDGRRAARRRRHRLRHEGRRRLSTVGARQRQRAIGELGTVAGAAVRVCAPWVAF